MNPLLANVHRKRRHTEMYTAKPTQQTTQHQQHQHQHQHQHHPPTRKYVPRQSSCSIPMQSSPFASCRRTGTGESSGSPSTYSPSSTGSCCRACRLGNPCPQQKLLSIASPTRLLSSPNSPCPSSPYSPCLNPDDEVVFKRIKLTPLTIPSKRTSTSTYSSPANLTTNTTSTSSTSTSTSSSSSSESRNRNLETEFQVLSHFPQYNTNPIADTTHSSTSTAAPDLEASNTLLLQLHQQLLEYTRHYQHLVNLCAQSLQQQQSQSQFTTQITQPSQAIQQSLTGTADPNTNTLAHHLTMQQQQLLQMVPTIANEAMYNPYTNSNSSQYPSSSSYVHVQPSTGSYPTFSPLYSHSFPTSTKEMNIINASPESYSHSYSESSTTTPILMPIPVSSIARTMTIETPTESSSRSISSDTSASASASASATSYSSPWSSRAASPSPSPPSPSRAIESASGSQSAATTVTPPASQS